MVIRDPTDMRRVHRLRLRAPDDALLRRGAILVEDALRTATVPNPGRGLLVVRRLDLGRFSSDATPASLALRVEACLRELYVRAVPADEPAARTANVVVFRDAYEPAVLLVAHAAEGRALDAWWWPRVVAWFDEATTAAQVLRAAPRAFAREGTTQALALAARAARGLLARGVASAWLDALAHEDDVPRVDTAPHDGARHPDDAVSWSVAPSLLALVGDGVARWSPRDARARWWAAVAVQCHRPQEPLALDDPSTAHRVDALLRRAAQRLDAARDEAHTETPTPDDETATHASHARAYPGRSARSDRRAEPTRAPQPTRGEAPARDARALPAGTMAPSAEARAAEEASPRPRALRPVEATREEATRATQLAGVVCVFNVLDRLGVASLFAQEPRLVTHGLPWRLVATIADALGGAAEPLSLALAVPDVWDDGPLAFAMPDGWPVASPGRRTVGATTFDGSGRLPLAIHDGLSAPQSIALAVSSLRVSVRRFCRRVARIGLADLVRRPGRFALSETHFEVWMPYAAIDLRVRREALDRDPGWCPWLGRVVRIHYVPDGRWEAMHD